MKRPLNIWSKDAAASKLTLWGPTGDEQTVSLKLGAEFGNQCELTCEEAQRLFEWLKCELFCWPTEAA